MLTDEGDMTDYAVCMRVELWFNDAENEMPLLDGTYETCVRCASPLNVLATAAEELTLRFNADNQDRLDLRLIEFSVKEAK
jgi:hypothetical protein